MARVPAACSPCSSRCSLGPRSSARPGSATSCATAAGSIGAALRETPHYMLGLNFLVDEPGRSGHRRADAGHQRRHSDALEIQMILGNLLPQKGQVARAITHAPGAAAAARPDQARARLRPALPRPRLPARRLRRSRARGVPGSACGSTPGTATRCVNLQKLHEEQHQWADALRVREQIVDARRPDDGADDRQILGFLRNEVGRSRARDGDAAAAAAALPPTRSTSTPRTVPAYLNLGDVRERQGDLAARRRRVGTARRDAVPERAYLAFDRLERAYAAARRRRHGSSSSASG